MKMTEHNWGRLYTSIFFVAGAIATGAQVHHGGSLIIHLFFALCAILLVARTIYSYMKGE